MKDANLRQSNRGEHKRCKNGHCLNRSLTLETYYDWVALECPQSQNLRVHNELEGHP